MSPLDAEFREIIILDKIQHLELFIAEHPNFRIKEDLGFNALKLALHANSHFVFFERFAKAFCNQYDLADIRGPIDDWWESGLGHLLESSQLEKALTVAKLYPVDWNFETAPGTKLAHHFAAAKLGANNQKTRQDTEDRIYRQIVLENSQIIHDKAFFECLFQARNAPLIARMADDGILTPSLLACHSLMPQAAEFAGRFISKSAEARNFDPHSAHFVPIFRLFKNCLSEDSGGALDDALPAAIASIQPRIPELAAELERARLRGSARCAPQPKSNPLRV